MALQDTTIKDAASGLIEQQEQEQQHHLLETQSKILNELEEIRKNIDRQQQEIDELRKKLETSASSGMSTTHVETIGAIDVSYLYSLSALRDALDVIPVYDGRNMAFVYFVEGCEEALNIISPRYEEYLVGSARKRLRGDARRSIGGTRFGSMKEFVSFLRKLYGPRETVYAVLGELAYTCQKPKESVTRYANRVKEIGMRILDAEKFKNNVVSANFKETNEENLVTSFIRGLNREIAARIVRNESLHITITNAIDVEIELEARNNIRRIESEK